MAGLDPAKTELIKPVDDGFLPWPGLLGVILLGFYYWTLNQFIVQRALGARTLDQGRKGAILAGFLKLPNLFLMIVPGLIALALYPELERADLARSEEHTSELQSLMRISYAVFCLKKKNYKHTHETEG